MEHETNRPGAGEAGPTVAKVLQFPRKPDAPIPMFCWSCGKDATVPNGAAIPPCSCGCTIRVSSPDLCRDANGGALEFLDPNGILSLGISTINSNA